MVNFIINNLWIVLFVLVILSGFVLNWHEKNKKYDGNLIELEVEE